MENFIFFLMGATAATGFILCGSIWRYVTNKKVVARVKNKEVVLSESETRAYFKQIVAAEKVREWQNRSCCHYPGCDSSIIDRLKENKVVDLRDNHTITPVNDGYSRITAIDILT